MYVVDIICLFNYVLDFKGFLLKHISNHKICCLAWFEHNAVSMHALVI